MLSLKCYNSNKVQDISTPNIPFCAEMNAESDGILHAMICHTGSKFLGGGNHPPLVGDVTQNTLVAQRLIILSLNFTST